MPRVKIDLPETFFDLQILIPVRITDINYGSHVGNDSIVAIIHEARMQLLQKHNYTELNIEGAGLIMADLAVEFKNESFYPDIIEVRIAKGEISKISFELYYQLTAKRNNQNILIAKAKTTMICFDYAAKKVAPLPEGLLKIITD